MLQRRSKSSKWPGLAFILLLSATTSSGGLERASIKKAVVPFLVGQLKSTDSYRADQAIVDLSYLGPLAVDALPALRSSRWSDDQYERRRVALAIRLIMGERPEISTAGPKDLVDLPVMYNRAPREPLPEPPLASDVSIRFVSPQRQWHVGEGVLLKFDIATTSAHKYGITGSRRYRLRSIVRLDPDGKIHPVDIPVSTLSRGGFYGGASAAGLSVLEVDHPWREDDFLAYEYVLDRPGKYRLTADAVVGVLASSVPVHTKGLFRGEDRLEYQVSTAAVRSSIITAEFEILPRDQVSSDRRLNEMTAAAMLLKDDEISDKTGKPKFDEDELIHLIDYRTIPALIHIIEVAGNGTTGGTAFHGLGYFRDKTRLRREILLDVKKNQRPHNEDEAGALAQALASAETITCGPEKSESDVDFVRWDVARMRWEDWMMGRLSVRKR
jgi:hypothetical protein